MAVSNRPPTCTTPTMRRATEEWESRSAAGTVSIAVVVDVEADDIPHQNGSKWKRLVMQRDAALELWHDLGKALGLGGEQ